MLLKFCVFLIIVYPLVSCSGKPSVHATKSGFIDLANGKEHNVIILEAPDSLTERQILLPEFKKFIHVAADGEHFRWIGASNRMYPWVGNKDLKSIFETKDPAPPRIPNPNRRAFTMLFQLSNGKYLTLLPLSGKESVSWIEVTKEGRLMLGYGSLGTEPVSKDLKVPLLAWYESENVYESIAKTWELATNNDDVSATGSLRYHKKYPDPLSYLGWCTWEQYRKNINQDVLTAAIDNIEKSGVPVRWLLIDDGHQDDEGRLLKSFTPNHEKFPNGWGPIVSRKQDDAIKWMGIWHGFLSHWDGVHVDHTMEELAPFLTPNPDREKGLLPKDDMESSTSFYQYLVTTIKNQGFDFLKTDNVSRSTIEYYGFPSASKAQRQNVLALEQACMENGIGLMNCSAQNTIDMLNASNSATMRTSPDYQKHNLATSKSQILQSVFNVLWLGQTLWPDHDMFHSSDNEVAETMAVTKAMSGGPIYLSDDPDEFEKDVINPLCYLDGKLIRPLAPGVPLPESIFNDAIYESQHVYKTISPLKNRSCAIAAYNLSITATEPLRGLITKDDYTYAPAMMQPFDGLWEIPTEGLVIYNWKEKIGARLDERGLEFEINGFGHKLFLLSPIYHGWAVIGRPDKYLSPSAIDLLDSSDESITFRIVEEGPIVLYSEKNKPRSEYLSFTEIGKGFFKGDPIKKISNNKILKISRLPE